MPKDRVEKIEDQKINVLVIQGTSRKGRRSINASKLIESVGKDIDNVKVKFADPREFNFPFDGNDDEVKDPKYTELVDWADAYFIVVPEYNHGYPGSLKRMLDSELKLYIHKPVAFAGVSGGTWGGVRAVEALVPAVREMGMVATFTDVNFSKISEVFSEKGELRDERYVPRIKDAYTELVWMAKVLKFGRKCLSSKHHARECDKYKS